MTPEFNPKTPKGSGGSVAVRFDPRATRMIFGLGNPGRAYEHTFHNLGARFAETLVKTEGGGIRFKRYARGGFRHAAVGRYTVVVPTVFMNESGKAYRKTLAFFGVSTEETLIVHDENDLPFGSYKFDFGRGDAGHKGVASIIHATGGGKNFWRLRLGIQPTTAPKRKKAEDFILSPLSAEDEKRAEALFREIIERHFVP